MESLLPLVRSLLQSRGRRRRSRGRGRTRSRRRSSSRSRSASSTPRLTYRQFKFLEDAQKREVEAVEAAPRDDSGRPLASDNARSGGWQRASGGEGGSSRAWPQQMSGRGDWWPATWRQSAGGHSGGWSKASAATWQQNAGGQDGGWSWSSQRDTSKDWQRHPRGFGAAPKWKTKRGPRGGKRTWQARDSWDADASDVEEEDPAEAVPATDTCDDDWWIMAKESAKLDPDRPLSRAEAPVPILQEASSEYKQELETWLLGHVHRWPAAVLKGVVDVFSAGGIEPGSVTAWNDKGFVFLHIALKSVQEPPLWRAAWYTYTFLHGTTLDAVSWLR